MGWLSVITELDWWDLSLRIVRGAGVVASASAGIAALLSDGAVVKVEPAGTRWWHVGFERFRFTRWGGALLAVILIAPAVQFVGDWIKDVSDSRTLRQTADEIQVQINSTVKQTANELQAQINATVKQSMAAASEQIVQTVRSESNLQLSQVWIAQHSVGNIEASIQFDIDPDNTDLQLNLGYWLRRVQARYREIKAKKMNLPSHSFDQGVSNGRWTKDGDYEADFGGNVEFFSIGGDQNLFPELKPSGPEEEVAVRALVRPIYKFEAIDESGKSALLSAKLEATDKYEIRVYIRTNGSIFRVSSTSTVRGFVTRSDGIISNWLDFYGRTLNFTPVWYRSRDRLMPHWPSLQKNNLFDRLFSSESPPPNPTKLFFETFEYRGVEFGPSNASWFRRASASGGIDDRLIGSAGNNAFYKSRGYLSVKNADWTILGAVPSDYPGERRQQFGAVR